MIEWRFHTELPVIGSLTSSLNNAQVIEQIIEQRDEIQQYLQLHGAVLFRGFPVESAEQFQGIASLFCSDFSDYIGGNSPRTKVASHVFTSTEYAKEERISMHNEASYLKRMPRRILFYCVTPSSGGGQTPIADCRNVLARIEPRVKARFEEKGILYVNNMHGGVGFGKSWMSVFGTKDRDVVEARLREDGYQFEWLPDSGLRTTMHAPATACHPETLETVWINQAEQWHPSSMNPIVRKQLLSIMHVDELPHNAFLGDGSFICNEDLENIREAMTAEERLFQWQRRDILLCDNYLVMHGRQPYSGERKILVAMG